MNGDVLEIQKGKSENFLACAEVDGFLYYSDRNKNGLCKVDLSDNKCSFVALFDEDLNAIGIHEFALLVGRDIWFFPYKCEERIAIFSVDTGSIEYMELPKCKRKYLGRAFSGGVVYQEHIWLIPNCYDAFVRIEPVSREILRIELDMTFEQEDVEWKFVSGTFYEGKIYLCPWECEHVIYLDCNAGEISILREKIPCEKYRNIVVRNEKVYLLPRELSTPILVVEQDKLDCIELAGSKGVYICVFEGRDGIVWMFPMSGNDIIQISLDNKTWTKMLIQLDEKCSWGEARSCGEYIVISAGNAKTPIIQYSYLKDKIDVLNIEVPKDMMVQRLIYAMSKEKSSLEKRQEGVGKRIFKHMNGEKGERV